MTFHEAEDGNRRTGQGDKTAWGSVVVAMQDTPKNHLGGLDIIRFFAALLVVVVHVCFSAWARNYSLAFQISGGGVALPSISSVTRCCWIGVEIFFVISGLVIAKSANGRTPYSFFRSRVARLMPAIWICATLTLSITISTGIVHWKWALYEYGRTVIFLLDRPWIDEVYWTLAVEVIFYALVSILLVANLFRHVLFFAIALTAISAAYLTMRLNGLPDGLPFTLPLQYGCFFATGIAFWILSEYGASSSRLLLLAASIGVGLLEIHIKTIDQAEPIGGPAIPLLAEGIWVGALCLMIASLFVRIENGITRKLGLMTYPLYLLHNSVGPAALLTATYFGSTAGLILAFVVPVLFSWLVVYLEKPIRDRLIRLIDACAQYFERLTAYRFLFKKTFPVQS